MQDESRRILQAALDCDGNMSSKEWQTKYPDLNGLFSDGTAFDRGSILMQAIQDALDTCPK